MLDMLDSTDGALDEPVGLPDQDVEPEPPHSRRWPYAVMLAAALVAAIGAVLIVMAIAANASAVPSCGGG